MALDLKQLEQDFAGAPLASPYSWALTAAVISDVYRLAGRAPPTPQVLREPAPRGVDQLGMLAHLLASTGLRAESVRALKLRLPDPAAALPPFFEAVEPITAEMIRANAFRREEFVRRWLEVVGGEVAGETPEQSEATLARLDYRTTLAEYARAEGARVAEAEKRAKLIKEAEERELAARGWRE